MPGVRWSHAIKSKLKFLACDSRTPYQIYGVCGRSHAIPGKAWYRYPYTGKSASIRCKISIVGLCSEYLAANNAARKNIQVAGEAGYTPTVTK